MKNCISRGVVFGMCLAVALTIGGNRTLAQQGKFVEQSTARLVPLIDKGNRDGYSLHDNTFSAGGGWLKQSTTWVDLYTVTLEKGRHYRFVAAGDNDARDVDLEVV